MVIDYHLGLLFSRYSRDVGHDRRIPFLTARFHQHGHKDATRLLRHHVVARGNLQLVSWLRHKISQAPLTPHVDQVTCIANEGDCVAVTLTSGALRSYDLSEAYQWHLNDRRGLQRRNWGQVAFTRPENCINMPMLKGAEVFQHTGPATGCEFLGSSLIVSASLNGSVCVHDLKARSKNPSFESAVPAPIRAVTLSSPFVILAALQTGSVAHMDLREPPRSTHLLCCPLNPSFAHQGDVLCLSVPRDQAVLTGGADGTIRLWDIRFANQLVNVLDRRRDVMSRLEGEGIVKRFPTEACTPPPRSHRGGVRALSSSPDYKVLVSQGTGLNDTIAWDTTRDYSNIGVICEEPPCVVMRDLASSGSKQRRGLSDLNTQISWIPTAWLPRQAPNICVTAGFGGFLHLVEMASGNVIHTFGSHLMQSVDATNPNLWRDRFEQPGPNYGNCVGLDEVTRALVCSSTQQTSGLLRILVAAPRGDIAVYETGFNETSDDLEIFYP